MFVKTRSGVCIDVPLSALPVGGTACSLIQKLAIQGVRAFPPGREQTIQFFRPLTMIVGMCTGVCVCVGVHGRTRAFILYGCTPTDFLCSCARVIYAAMCEGECV